jgi:transposase-like protein
MNNSQFMKGLQKQMKGDQMRKQQGYWEQQKRLEQQKQQKLKTKKVIPLCSNGHLPITMILEKKYKSFSCYKCPKCGRRQNVFDIKKILGNL